MGKNMQPKSFKELLSDSPIVKNPKAFLLWMIPAILVYAFVCIIIGITVDIPGSIHGISLLVLGILYCTIIQKMEKTEDNRTKKLLKLF
jgi:hypothetical protein